MNAIDRLAVRVPESAPFARRFRQYGEAIRKGGAVPGLKRWDEHYRAVLDLRALETLDLRVSLSNRHTKSAGWLRDSGLSVELADQKARAIASRHFPEQLPVLVGAGESPEPADEEETGDDGNSIPGAHKVEVYDAGDKSLEQMVSLICEIFDVNPWQLDILRLDLCADIPGVPVPWFIQNMRVAYKRFHAKISKGTPDDELFMTMGTARPETAYAGKRPNCFRVYDKPAELRYQFSKWLRKINSFNRGLGRVEPKECNCGEEFDPLSEYGSRVLRWQSSLGHGSDCRGGVSLTARQRSEWVRCFTVEVPKFEDFHPGTLPNVLTRVEREMGGGLVPAQVSKPDKLWQLPEFNPFDKLKTYNGTVLPGGPETGRKISMRDHLAGLGLRYLLENEKDAGIQGVENYVRKYSNNHGGEIMNALRDYLVADSPGVTAAEIYERYRESVVAQLN